MHLAIYIHDFFPQIGHARAMIELLNGLTNEQKKTISSIEIVAFSSAPVEDVFNNFECPKYFTQIPFPKIKPFIFKMFFYHIITLTHSLLKGKNKIKIGVGIASLNVDIVNVQFIHEQWKEYFFRNRNLSIISLIYKKILFCYFSLSEKYVYSQKSKYRYIVIAKFLQNYLHQKFSTPLSLMTLIPSGVNSSEFSLLDKSNDELFDSLSKKYPELKILDNRRPIALFVGALERKGLPKVLEMLQIIPDAQLIVIGKSEQAGFKMPKMNFKIAHINFTKEVSLFYQLADSFIFPTVYEPFGLVIIEAYAMGLDLVLPIENVGASEIIPAGEGIHFFHQKDKIEITTLKKIPIEIKKSRREIRLKNIEVYKWENSAQKFYKMLIS